MVVVYWGDSVIIGYVFVNGSRIKHIYEMKADIKLCISYFSVVTLPGFFLLDHGHLLGTCVWC